MKIKKLKIEKLIRITSIASPSLLSNEYVNKIFVMTSDETQFVDWLNGHGGSFTKPLAGVVYERMADGYSTGSGQDMSINAAEYVKTLLTARTLIQKGELSYRFENAESVGAEPWFKKSQSEVDLILKNIINQTPGVAGIKNFKSTVNSKREYSCEVEIICEGGESLWQSIGI